MQCNDVPYELFDHCLTMHSVLPCFSMMRREGEVLFNGAKMEKHMKRAIGYVMQDDLLYESLTVFEVVRF